MVEVLVDLGLPPMYLPAFDIGLDITVNLDIAIAFGKIIMGLFIDFPVGIIMALGGLGDVDLSLPIIEIAASFIPPDIMVPEAAINLAGCVVDLIGIV